MDTNGVQGAGVDAQPRGAARPADGTMQAPISKFVRTLNEVPGRFVRTVAALRDEREKAAAGEQAGA
jgi:large subunit ribosomal protein L10